MIESLIHPLFETAEAEAPQRARQLLDDRLSQRHNQLKKALYQAFINPFLITPNKPLPGSAGRRGRLLSTIMSLGGT
jgi:hypothetical protein